MIPYASQIKKLAKESLRNNSFCSVISSCMLIFAFLFAFMIFEILGFVTNILISAFVTFLICVFAVFPLALGVFRYFRRIMYGVCDSPMSVFYYFSEIPIYIKAENYIISILIRKGIISAILLIPSFILKLISMPFVYDVLGVEYPIWASLLSSISYYLAIISFFVYIVLTLKYYLSPFLFVSNDDISVSDSIKMSIIISKRTWLDFIYLIFNILLYVLLSVFLIPLPITLPIIISCYVLHSIYAIKQYNDTIDNINEQRG